MQYKDKTMIGCITGFLLNLIQKEWHLELQGPGLLITSQTATYFETAISLVDFTMLL